MSIITDYFNEIYTTALGHPAVTSVQRVPSTEDISGQIGVYRYRIHLTNGAHVLHITGGVTTNGQEEI